MNSYKKCWAAYLFAGGTVLAFPKFTVLQMRCWNSLPWGCWCRAACEGGLVLPLAGGSNIKAAAVFSAVSTQFSPVLSVLHAGSAGGKRQALGSRDGRRMEVPSVLESSWEPVCGPRARSACQQPAGLTWCGEKSSPGAGTCWVLKNNHLPLLSLHPPPLLPHVVWAKFSLTVKSLSRGGGREVIWTDCLLLNYQQSSWAWLNVWCCCFLRHLMKGCLELDEEQFCIRMLKVIPFFFHAF